MPYEIVFSHKETEKIQLLSRYEQNTTKQPSHTERKWPNPIGWILDSQLHAPLQMQSITVLKIPDVFKESALQWIDWHEFHE